MKGVGTSEERIGRYRLLERLGEGGMGVVHLGVDPQGRKVAIKVLRPAIAGDATALRRLAREVDTMRRVHNPHVAEIIDADVTAEQPYVVTQYVPGATLDQKVADGGPLRGRALQRLAAGLAEALAAIHAAGVVHRDLKPGNVMFLDGEPVVIDFGIAQAVDATRLTATGLVIGTPGYLAPEIIEGEDATAASDVHSWASALAYAATGRPPFGSGTFESIFYKIMQGEPDLHGVPEALLPLIRAAMAHNPAERPTASTLARLSSRIDLETDLHAGRAAQATRMEPLAETRRLEAIPEAATPPMPARPWGGRPAARPGGGPGARPGAARPGSAPGRYPASPKDFRGLLPPAPPPAVTTPAAVATPAAPGAYAAPPYRPYGPYARPGARVARAGESAAQAGPGGVGEAAKPYGWYRLLNLALLAATLGLAAMVPMVTLVAVTVALILLRAADRAAKGLADRRASRGPSTADVMGAVVKSPLRLPRAVLTTALLSPLGVMVGLAVLFFLVVARPDMSAARTISYGVAAFVALQCVGPGSGAPRRQLSRTWAVMLPTYRSAVIAAGALGLIAAFLVSFSFSQIPDLRPFDVTWAISGIDSLKEAMRELFGTG